MAEVTWFKVLTDIFADDKIKIIQSMPEGDALLVMWFKVLSQAGKTNDGGYIYLKKNIPYTSGMLSTLFGKQQQLVELAMRTFSEFGMIDIDDKGYIFVTNWERHQSIDKLNQIKEKTKLRVQSHREKKKLELQESNATVTLPKQPSNAIDLEVDLELEIDKESSTATAEPETLDETHRLIYGHYSMTGMISGFIVKYKKKGFTDAFIREVLMEAAETCNNGKPSIRQIESIAERWERDMIFTRAQNKQDRDNIKQFPKAGQAPYKTKLEQEMSYLGGV